MFGFWSEERSPKNASGLAHSKTLRACRESQAIPHPVLGLRACLWDTQINPLLPAR
jgi:hypothetical protein